MNSVEIKLTRLVQVITLPTFGYPLSRQFGATFLWVNLNLEQEHVNVFFRLPIMRIAMPAFLDLEIIALLQYWP